MKVQSRFSGQLALACGTSLSVLLALSIAISNLLKERAPDIALSLAPFSDEARIESILRGIIRYQSDPDGHDLGELREAAERGVTLAPADARSYSLLGETYLLAGEEEIAAQLFARALAQSKTEIHALQRSLEMAARQGRFAEAMELVDVLFRRWPSRFDSVAPHLALMLQSPEAYAKTLELLQGSPPWARRFFRALADNEQGLALAYRLQMDLNREGGQVLAAEAAHTMQALIRAGQYALAYRLFLFTQTEEDRRIAGYVFNGDFSHAPSGRPFDWQIRDNAGAEAKWSRGDSGQGEVLIRFLGKPVKTVAVTQGTYLPPGEYSLAMQYSAAGLELPRNLFLRVSCAHGRDEAVRIQIPEDRVENGVLSAGFSVMPGQCELYLVSIVSALIADSFRYAYRGNLTLHSVKIDRTEP